MFLRHINYELGLWYNDKFMSESVYHKVIINRGIKNERGKNRKIIETVVQNKSQFVFKENQNQTCFIQVIWVKKSIL